MRKKLHGRILREEPKEQQLSTVPKSCSLFLKVRLLQSQRDMDMKGHHEFLNVFHLSNLRDLSMKVHHHFLKVCLIQNLRDIIDHHHFLRVCLLLKLMNCFKFNQVCVSFKMRGDVFRNLPFLLSINLEAFPLLVYMVC